MDQVESGCEKIRKEEEAGAQIAGEAEREVETFDFGNGEGLTPFQQTARLTKCAVAGGDSSRFLAFSYLRAFSALKRNPRPPTCHYRDPLGVTQQRESVK